MKLSRALINYRFLFILTFILFFISSCEKDNLEIQKVEVLISSDYDKFNFTILSLPDEKVIYSDVFDNRFLSADKLSIKIQKGNYILVATNTTEKIKIPFAAFNLSNEVYVSFNPLEPFPAK